MHTSAFEMWSRMRRVSPKTEGGVHAGARGVLVSEAENLPVQYMYLSLSSYTYLPTTTDQERYTYTTTNDMFRDVIPPQAPFVVQYIVCCQSGGGHE
ncbi:hypothetical protein BaRGS_00020415 [Batillaria attramentaria]|uniref:Uncharacterized protein n=1 Tax=Batillaria attramentaria TaxID=370345 RepID=A0ABD0KMG9_9CAEN